ncbi:hypothetical protein PMAYCL1PPCAC_09376, partial [Pristionchus mayeri]
LQKPLSIENLCIYSIVKVNDGVVTMMTWKSGNFDDNYLVKVKLPATHFEPKSPKGQLRYSNSTVQ